MKAIDFYKILGLVMALLFAGVTGAMAQQQTCGETSWNLTAGQTIDVGSITIENDANYLYITYSLDYPGATFGTLHAWVGSPLSGLPSNPQGIPVPGQFPFQSGKNSFPPSEGLTEYTFSIPLNAIKYDGKPITGCAELELYVVTHAEVRIDTNGDGIPDKDETAFGGNKPGNGPRWWFYDIYKMCCDFGGGGLCFYETAYAKGTHVFASDKKANPDKLPSLNLTRNQWGWAINLTQTGEFTYDMWAGAGLNRTNVATKVGTLTVNWNGTFAELKFTMLPGYYLEEVHIYAGDVPQKTTAPGQYGYPTEGYDVGGVQYFEYTVSLTDNDRDGVWISAHAAVSNGQCN